MSKDLRKEVSLICGYTFTDRKWLKNFRELQKEGRIGMKQVLELLALILEVLDEKE